MLLLVDDRGGSSLYAQRRMRWTPIGNTFRTSLVQPRASVAGIYVGLRFRRARPASTATLGS